MLENPVSVASMPDPSFCRVGEDFTSRPRPSSGIRGCRFTTARSRELDACFAAPAAGPSSWTCGGTGQLRHLGACLSYADGRFWLVYTDVKRLDGAFKDAHNYIVTCATIDGDWSDPKYVNSWGLIRPCSTTGTGGKGSSTCAGTIARRGRA